MPVLPQLLAGLGVDCEETVLRGGDEHLAVGDKLAAIPGHAAFATEGHGPGRHEVLDRLFVLIWVIGLALAPGTQAEADDVAGVLASLRMSASVNAADGLAAAGESRPGDHSAGTAVRRNPDGGGCMIRSPLLSRIGRVARLPFVERNTVPASAPFCNRSCQRGFSTPCQRETSIWLALAKSEPTVFWETKAGVAIVTTCSKLALS